MIRFSKNNEHQWLKKDFFLVCYCMNESPSGRCWHFWVIIISYRIINRQTSGTWGFFYSFMCIRGPELDSAGHWGIWKVCRLQRDMVQCVLATQLMAMRE